MYQLYLFALANTAIEMTVCLLCAMQLAVRKQEPFDMSRRLLAFGALISGILAAYALFSNITMQVTDSPIPFLRPWNILTYTAMHIIMTLYPISIVRQEWISFKHIFLLFCPLFIFAIIFLFYIGNWTFLPTASSVWDNAHKLDVIIRLTSLFAMVPYCLILFWLPYNYRRSSATLDWIVRYSLGLTLLCFVHITLMLTYSIYLINAMPLIAAVFYYLSTKYEIDERLRPPVGQAEGDVPLLETNLQPLEGVSPEFGLWSRVCQIMDEEEAWRNPDLTLVELARLACTNTTYLNRILRQEVNMGFKEYVNEKRIKSVAEQLRKTPCMDIQEAFFNAGFRSRTTAWRNFKDIIGKTPTEFKQSLR